MNIIIPIGGIGKRFSDEGYQLPKPLIKSLGESIIVKCIKSLKVETSDVIYILYRIELDKYNFKDIITKNFSHNFKFIPINYDTRGAAETVFIALESMNDSELKELTIVVDSDNVYNNNIIGDIKEVNDNVIFYFKDTTPRPLFSYITIKNGYVQEIKEKVKISDFACSGAYGFKSGKTLKEFITKTIKGNLKSKNEFYTSTIYNLMLKNNVVVNAKECNDYTCLGTPDQLKIHSSFNTKTSKRICFDLDNTLVTYPKIKNDYKSVEPIQKNIDYLKHLKRQGNTIIIYTARRMKTHGGNIGLIVRDIGQITLDTLNKFEVPYDEIYFGKPYADFYIDDLAVKSYDNLEQEVGFYNLHPETRSHNKIEIYNNKIVKHSTDISGEKFWYENIPQNTNDIFPTLISSTDNSITISRVNGIPLSHLNINNILTPHILTKVLESLKQLHTNPYSENVNIYGNYLSKLRKRLKDFNYLNYEGINELVKDIELFLENYENRDRGVCGVIHGDPVLTNILVDNFDNLKFIDMRGKVGDTLTTSGDIFYDYAKVYQSIIGYDFILMDKLINTKTVESNKKVFEEFIISHHGEDRINDIKWITKSLLLTLIPLHDNEKCVEYYNLIKTI